MTYRKYINIVEAANKGCPIATYDIDVNLKNRQRAIDESCDHCSECGCVHCKQEAERNLDHN